MPDLVKMLRDLADAYEREAEKESKGEESAALTKRIDELEAQLKSAAKREPGEVEEALDRISDEEYELVLAHRKGLTAKPAEGKPAEEKPQVRTRPGRKKGSAYAWTVDDDGKVVKTDIAHIYSGEDEPDEVELPAEVEEPAAA